MLIFTIRTADEDGDAVSVFTSEKDANQAAHNWCKKHWCHDHAFPADWREAYEQIDDFEAYICFEEHEIDTSYVVEVVTKSARVQIADLIGQIHQMQGMFNDADGSIQQAIDDAEAWPGVAAPA